MEAIKDPADFAETGDPGNMRYEPGMGSYFVDADSRIHRPVQSWVEVKFYDQARQYFGKLHPNVTDIDLTGVEEHLAIDVLRRIDELVPRFKAQMPWLPEDWFTKLSSIVAEEGTWEDDTADALSWAFVDGSGITVNTEYFSSKKRLITSVADRVDDFTFIEAGARDPLGYVLAHELGHIALASLPQKQKEYLPQFFDSLLGYAEDYDLSSVAMQNSDELFAELVAHLMVAGKSGNGTASVVRELLDIFASLR